MRPTVLGRAAIDASTALPATALAADTVGGDAASWRGPSCAPRSARGSPRARSPDREPHPYTRAPERGSGALERASVRGFVGLDDGLGDAAALGDLVAVGLR